MLQTSPSWSSVACFTGEYSGIVSRDCQDDACALKVKSARVLAHMKAMILYVILSEPETKNEDCMEIHGYPSLSPSSPSMFASSPTSRTYFSHDHILRRAC